MGESRRDYDIVAAAASATGISASGDVDVGQAEAVDHSGVAEYVPTPIAELERRRARLPSPAATVLDDEEQMRQRVLGATPCILEPMEPLDDTESQKTTGETSGESQASSKSERGPQTSAKKPKPHKFGTEKTTQSKLSQFKESVKGKTVTSTATQVEKDLHFGRTAERKALSFGERGVKGSRWTSPLNFTGHDSPSIPTSPSTSTPAR